MNVEIPIIIMLFFMLSSPELSNLEFIVIKKINSLLTSSSIQLHILRNQEYCLYINTLWKILLHFVYFIANNYRITVLAM